MGCTQNYSTKKQGIWKLSTNSHLLLTEGHPGRFDSLENVQDTRTKPSPMAEPKEAREPSVADFGVGRGHMDGPLMVFA